MKTSVLAACLAALAASNAIAQQRATAGGDQSQIIAQALGERLWDPDGYVRVAAADALEQMAPASVAVLVQRLQDADGRGRQLACVALREIGPGAISAAAALCARLQDPEAAVRQATVMALRDIQANSQGVAAALAQAVRDPDGLVSVDAAETLDGLGGTAVPPVVELLRDCNPRVRELAVRILGAIGPAAKAALPALAERLGDEVAPVRFAAVLSIRNIVSETPPPAQ